MAVLLGFRHLVVYKSRVSCVQIPSQLCTNSELVVYVLRVDVYKKREINFIKGELKTSLVNIK